MRAAEDRLAMAQGAIYPRDDEGQAGEGRALAGIRAWAHNTCGLSAIRKFVGGGSLREVLGSMLASASLIWRVALCGGIALIASACNLSRLTPTPRPTPDLPRVEILSPPTSQLVIEGTEFDLDILAVDQSKGIARVELYIDDVLFKTSEAAAGPQPQYRVAMNWYARGRGWHAFRVIAYREDGTRSDEHTITLKVIARS